MNKRISISSRDVLLVIDVQNDFISGTVAIPDAPAIIPVINELTQHFSRVVFTQDWHPSEHVSFASRHGLSVGAAVETAYGPQMVFADHCIRGGFGAELPPDLNQDRAVLKLYKGYRADVDSFSAFTENDGLTRTGLASYLRGLEVRRVFLAGLSLYGCVRHSALDAIQEGFNVYVIVDACKARSSSKNALYEVEMTAHGVRMISSKQIEQMDALRRTVR
ncbi:isochorismatase family protein [Paraburkholderia sediminicola]|uniref:isochorismatase family protein n=1 Tax=Paraburkholderia sediminicola TaxID=458836 RepID=UPI0038B94D77